jgi:hypothetical protein
MAEYLNNDVQTVAPGAAVALRTSIGCTKGFIYHRPESGILILRGVVNNPCSNFARYQVTFNGNIAVAEGAPGPIAVALAVDGEPIATSTAIVTPTVAEAYFNVTSTAIIDVPRGCCLNLSVENVPADPTAVTTPTINVQNSNLTVSRIA